MEHNSETDLEKVWYEDGDQIELAQGTVQWRDLANTKMNLQAPQESNSDRLSAYQLFQKTPTRCVKYYDILTPLLCIYNQQNKSLRESDLKKQV